MAAFEYDLVTLGAGSGGVRASRLASGYGARVAVIEESRVGGTCVVRGCVPKKLLIYGAEFARSFQDACGYGWAVGDVHLDWPALVASKNRELDRLEAVYRNTLKSNHVELVEGRGRLVDPHTVEVNGRRMTAQRILVAVGGWPVLPDIPGVEHAITSNEALDLPRLPDSIVIVGGGFIAVEFAGLFRALGCAVTLVIRADNILRGFDQDIREHLVAELEHQGIAICRKSQVQSIRCEKDGRRMVTLQDGRILACEQVMYATGRAPNTAGLGLEEAGVALDPRTGAVQVDAWSRTNVSSIWAVGDVTNRINLTPVAIREGACFAETEFNNNPMTPDHANVASAVFSQPAVGMVGLTEEQARARGPVDVYVTRFRPMKNTLSGREERTMMKLLVDRATQVVIGAHMVGPDAPEIIQGLAIAVKASLTKKDFDATVGIHPTAAEEFVTLRTPRPDPVSV
ncbi:glutathione-disulfide reductase [Haematospirillum sp. H1815]|uniref:glutathione-disulfide reductase n=1 Tax=Haematospirillum sp. H1815 TaxID=2723108 RepID=UPI00143CBCE1|nr:glutathione-disulfide reductase [Haematospirillum sp. H1815]NKD76182.1 glutathione-disulfide reductase [Haematospirillum sp. H1815]